MSVKVQRLRVLVNERLTAAAEEIFALFERTIVEYEEEMCRSKEENKRKQQLLDSGLKPQQDVKEEPEELSIQQEPPQDVTSVSVKSEDLPSLLQQRQTEENREQIDRQDCETTEQTDNEDHWTQPVEADTEDINRGNAEESCSESKNTFRSDVGGNTKQCSFCKKTFKWNVDLQRHILIHSGKRPFICSVCNKGFTQRHHLSSHMITHTGERPFSCSVCAKTFTQKTNLRLHAATHTGERPFSCPVCDKSFIQKANLRSHMLTHTGEKPFSCPHCDAKFTQKNNLVRHMTVHSGEKAFGCSVCGKGFTSKAKLKGHVRTHHEGEKPLGCSECDARFTLKLNLSRHLEVHRESTDKRITQSPQETGRSSCDASNGTQMNSYLDPDKQNWAE